MPSRYEQVKRRYRDSIVATTYDSSRFLSARGQKRNRLALAAIQRAFDKAASLGTPSGEAAEAGLQVVGIFSQRSGRSIFSDKWVVLLEEADGKKGIPAA